MIQKAHVFGFAITKRKRITQTCCEHDKGKYEANYEKESHRSEHRKRTESESFMRLLHSLYDGTIAVRILEECKTFGV